ncbi:AGAP005036-PA-like protein [Anopheles sinensis]|uniref:AGAP005036-PA-like protein n=1 Tax=Anopheles sinensis TaxID=74873 RepID=A0A084WKZ2_ANOSI|nr:AGAP005036-PA-like protein [Anopheles sinensis]
MAPGSASHEHPPQVASSSRTEEHKKIAASSKANVASAAPDPYSYAPMNGALLLLRNHNAINYRTLDFLHETNQDYIVVGTVGMPGVGKSTILNMLNTNLYYRDHANEKSDKIFPVHSTINLNGENEVKMYITDDRLILLDCSECIFGHTRKDFIQYEQDELKKMMILLKSCHVILVVQEEYYNIRLILFVRNKVNPYNASSQTRGQVENLYKNIFRNSPSFSITHDTLIETTGNKQEAFNYIEFPALGKGETVDTNDHLKETILSLRKLVYAGRETIMVNNCTEKAWGQALVKLVDSQEGNFFIDKYEKLKDKYNLHNHVKIVEHSYRDPSGLHFIE